MPNADYESEIHKLLKLGDHIVLPHDEPEQHVPEHFAVAQINHNNSAEAVLDIRPAVSALKNFLVYPAIFIAAFIFFYTVLNFPSLLAQTQGFFAPAQDEQILGDNLTEYYKWINNYYYAIGDKKLLDPNNDIDKDGLSNLDEFTMKTNPIIADSDGDGFSDGIEVINSQNPWGQGSMSAAQRKLAENLDLIMINNRVSFNVSQNNGIVAGEKKLNYDLNKPGRLSIPKLNITVPLIWSKDPADFDADLFKGIIHYPGTAMPGENGTIYVSGHSSDYLWKKNPYHNIFAKLNFLKPGDDIFVDVYGIDGKVFNYRYQVTGSKTYAPDDQTQFIDNSGSKLNLSTCWPIGTQKDRLVVTAVPVGL